MEEGVGVAFADFKVPVYFGIALILGCRRGRKGSRLTH